MTRLLAVAAVLGVAVARVGLPANAALDQTQPPSPATPVPVVVELFTSEGCSSCPPADDVLTRLVATQPVAGAQIVALGEHVDYWDRLGWRDAFSSPAFSRRQTEYADRVFRSGSIYTPQLVVNGREAIVGSDYRGAVALIAKAIRTSSRLRISLAIDSASPAQPLVRLDVSTADGASLKSSAEIWLAIVENDLTTKVARGENGGRTLQHSAVVRTMRTIGAIAPASSSWSSSSPVAFAGDWNRPKTRVVAFAQDHSSREILGAAVARP
jgi:hypothetical protein